MANELSVGDRLFVVANERHSKFQGHATISKVGRKYFEFNEFPYVRFLLSDRTSEHKNVNRRYDIYDSEEIYLREQEQKSLFCEIRARFVKGGYLDFSLEKLKQIKEIIED